MNTAEATCWSLIRDAAGGDHSARERFAQVYLPVVKAYLAARWRSSPQPPDADDAAQDVFVECFRVGGLLEKADPGRDGGFRAFLLGAVRNVARRHESRLRPSAPLPDHLPAEDTGAAEVFDRAWARALLATPRVQENEARSTGPAAERRVTLLRLRFQNGLSIKEIAEQWEVDAAKLHHEYATAREEFRAALRVVVAYHNPGAPPAELDRIAAELPALLG